MSTNNFFAMNFIGEREKKWGDRFVQHARDFFVAGI